MVKEPRQADTLLLAARQHVFPVLGLVPAVALYNVQQVGKLKRKREKTRIEREKRKKSHIDVQNSYFLKKKKNRATHAHDVAQVAVREAFGRHVLHCVRVDNLVAQVSQRQIRPLRKQHVHKSTLLKPLHNVIVTWGM